MSTRTAVTGDNTLERALIRLRVRAASATPHHALASRFTRQRAAAEQRH